MGTANSMKILYNTSLLKFKLKLNGTHHLLAYTGDVNLLGHNMYTIKRITETLIDASKEVCLEVSAEKTKYMLLSRHMNPGENHELN
jgi:hypothetical protein